MFVLKCAVSIQNHLFRRLKSLKSLSSCKTAAADLLCTQLAAAEQFHRNVEGCSHGNNVSLSVNMKPTDTQHVCNTQRKKKLLQGEQRVDVK